MAFPSTDKKAATLEVVGHWQQAAKCSHRRIFRRINMMLAGKSQANSAVDQQPSEYVQNPVEALDQANSSKDEDAAHEERTEDPPKEDAALVLLRNGKVPEDHEKDEKIVYTEGKFEHVTGNEFQSHLSPLPKENQSGKSSGEGDPHGATGE